MKVNEMTKVVLASSSKLFLEGIRRILEGENHIQIAAEVSNPKDIEKYVTEIKPGFLFIDNRILNLDIEKLLKIMTKKCPDSKVILLDNQTKEDFKFPNVIHVTKESNSSELINIIKSKSSDKSLSTKTEGTNKLTKMESRVIELIVGGFSNKEIANKLSISDKTVKAHLTNIFMKLNIENRYQLIVYGTQNKRRVR
ncbi:MAG: response regulator transcription factor [Deltaproteobacteria bacterium]|nr:response regulator transcription factor [Deltaproteobacteria bacterium]